jgi:hypothetical protein
MLLDIATADGTTDVTLRMGAVALCFCCKPELCGSPAQLRDAVRTAYSAIEYTEFAVAFDIWQAFAKTNNKQTPWPLVRKRTIPTDDRRLSAKFSANFCG